MPQEGTERRVGDRAFMLGVATVFSPPPAHSIAGRLRLPSKVHQGRYRQPNQHDRGDPGRSGNLVTFRHRKLIDNHNDQQRYLRQRKPNDQVSHYFAPQPFRIGRKEKKKPSQFLDGASVRMNT
jgi:hypothetical protein